MAENTLPSYAELHALSNFVLRVSAALRSREDVVLLYPYATLCILLAKSRPEVGGGRGFPSFW